MPDYRSMFDREYIGSWDLQGRDVVVTIAKVEAGNLVSQGNRKSRKPILHFAGREKGLVLNKVNAKTVAALYGNDVSAWVGKRVTLYPTTTSFGHETVDCIRIRPNAPKSKTDTEPPPAETRTCPEHGTFTGEYCTGCAEGEVAS